MRTPWLQEAHNMASTYMTRCRSKAQLQRVIKAVTLLINAANFQDFVDLSWSQQVLNFLLQHLIEVSAQSWPNSIHQDHHLQLQLRIHKWSEEFRSKDSYSTHSLNICMRNMSRILHCKIDKISVRCIKYMYGHYFSLPSTLVPPSAKSNVMII